MASHIGRIGVDGIKSCKGGTPLVCLTAYTTPMAKFLDAYCDLLLVGDSLAMVIYGLETTRGVTLDIMVAHGQAVMRGSKHACVVVDLPQGTYETSSHQAIASAAHTFVETGCQAVKLEGGTEIADTVRYLDKVFEELYDHVPENTHIIVTADHGELFGEKGYFGHGPIMHDKVFEVPYVEGKIR